VTPRELATYLLAFPEVTEENPFGPEVDVYKVAGKMFAILDPDAEPPSISLKCDPALALELRAEYAAVTPGYHLNKDHWNTVRLDGTVPEVEVREMVAHSFDQVVAGMTRAARARLTDQARPAPGGPVPGGGEEDR
jgi:predicted DNA-binding protein (MmcQ/YjbR family)